MAYQSPYIRFKKNSVLWDGLLDKIHYARVVQRFLERLAIKSGLEVISIGWWGSYKMLVNAVSTRWLTHKQLRPGFHRFYDLMFPFLCFVDGRRQSKKYITDTWILMKKPVAK